MNFHFRRTPAVLANKDETILWLTALVERTEAENARLTALVETQARQIETLTTRVAELEEKLGLPPKTPDNSSVPPSKGQKPSEDAKPKDKSKPHAGAHRPLHPNPTSWRNVFAERCRCGADLSSAPQSACEAYDRIEIPEIKPDITRVTLHGGKCPCCGDKFKAEAPADMPRGSPFGPHLRAFLLYMRFAHGVSFERLAHLASDIAGLAISEGAIVNIIDAARTAFAAQTDAIRARLLSGTAIESDETGMRVGKKNRWLWVFHHGDSAVFVAGRRTRKVVEDFLGPVRPDYWVSDRCGSQTDWAMKDHQFCLAHLIRDAKYAEECGDAVFAPKFIMLLKRACAIGRRRESLADSTLKSYASRLETDLDALIRLAPSHAAGRKFQWIVKGARCHLFVFVTRRDIPATNNGSERALRPSTVFRKITNGFRTEWGVKFYADIRSVIETGRRRSVGAFEAIRLTLAGKPLPVAE
jgi:transposase